MSIRKDFINGVFWIATAKYSGILVSLIVTAILARKISPAAFGTIAVAMVILHFLNILADIGIGPAIVQYKELSQKKLNDIFTLTLLIGILLSGSLYIGAYFIASYYKNAVLVSVCQWMCIVIFFNSINVVPNGLMRREKRFKTIALRTLFFHVLSGSLAVWAAFRGWGIYALLISPIITAIGVFSVNYYNYPLQLVYHIKKTSITAVSSFSIYQFLFSFFNYFSRNLDKLIIGRQFSMAQLGYYDKSYHLMMLPIQNISAVIDPVLHPVLATLKEHKEELKSKNIKLAKNISNISFPIGLILYFCGAEIIRIVYGNKWDAAIPIFQILALSLPLQVIFSTIAPFYQSADKTKVMFYGGMLNTIITVSGFIISAICIKTIEAVAWSWNITLLINFLNSYSILHIWALRESPNDFFKALLPQMVNSTIVFIISLLLFKFFTFPDIFIGFLTKAIFIIVLSAILGHILHQYNL